MKENNKQNLGKVVIIGGCATRDIFSHLNAEKILYFARTSFISLASQPLSIDEDKIDIKGNFERRMVAADFDKRAINQILEFQPELIIVDFLTERFDIVEIGNSRVSLSNYLIQSGLLKSFPEHKILKRDVMHNEWFKACEKLSEFFNSLDIPVVVHRALWATEYLNNDTGKIVSFNKKEQEIALKNNQQLNDYYSKFLSMLTHGYELSPDESLIYSDFAHKWGRDYFHYSEEYYISMAEKITRLWNNYLS